MTIQPLVSDTLLESFVKDPTALANQPASLLFSLPKADSDRIQLAGLRRHLHELAPQVPAIADLVDENKILDLQQINDVVPLLLPHTACKSYPLSLIDNARFSDLNVWLDRYTKFDLSSIDASGCQSLDDWLARVEAQSPVRVLTSSGTSGKLSLIPRSTIENAMLPAYFRAFFSPFGSEPGFDDPFAPGIYHVSPQLPGGRHSTALAARYIVECAYHGDPQYYVTPEGEMSTDVLWMSGRLRKAQLDGDIEKLKRSKSWMRLGERVQAVSRSRAASLDQFYCDTATRLKGKTVILRMGITFLRDMVDACERNGVPLSFHPSSLVVAAGGLKGQAALSDDEMAHLRAALPYPMTDVYACSETYGGLARRCQANHYHAPPWLVSFVLAPTTGEPFPREGVRTGRYAAFDLWAQTYWGGYITGDEVTIDWDGECECGRRGPYMHGKITRYIDKNGGDDKITCQRTAAAVSEMLDQLQGQTRSPAPPR